MNNKDILDYKAISIRLKEVREKRGFSISALSKLSGVDSASISNFENNRKRIGLNNLVLLCDALNVSVDYILYGDNLKPDRKIRKESKEDIFYDTIINALKKSNVYSSTITEFLKEVLYNK